MSLRGPCLSFGLGPCSPAWHGTLFLTHPGITWSLDPALRQACALLSLDPAFPLTGTHSPVIATLALRRGPSVGEGSWDRAYYQIRVGAFHPETNAIESMVTSDPYARCTSADGERAMVVDMRDPDLRPSSWGKTSAPRCEDATDIAVYELHIRDFSATDPSVPPEHRGKYAAFGLRGAQAAQERVSVFRDGLATAAPPSGPRFDSVSLP